MEPITRVEQYLAKIEQNTANGGESTKLSMLPETAARLERVTIIKPFIYAPAEEAPEVPEEASIISEFGSIRPSLTSGYAVRIEQVV